MQLPKQLLLNNHSQKLLLLAFVLFLSALLSNCGPPRYQYYKKHTERDNWIIKQQVKASWDDVNEALKETITSNGLVISYTSHVKDFLDRTMASTKFKDSVYKDAEVHLFCKVSVSHVMVQDNPDTIAGCPYGIAVYELMSEKGVVYLSYRKHQHHGVRDLLQKLVKQTIEELQ